MDRRRLLALNRRQILDTAARYGASNVRVFGSAARHDAEPSNDIDLLVQMDRGRTMLDLVGLWQDLEELLGCKVDVVTEGGISPYLRRPILDGAVAL